MKTAIIITMFPIWAYGMLKLWHVVRPIKPNRAITATRFDLSNRFNRLMISWQVDREPWILAKYPEFAYLKYDVGEQAKIIEESEK
jgi:hypothetical protein